MLRLASDLTRALTRGKVLMHSHIAQLKQYLHSNGRMEHDEALVFDEVQCEGLTAGAHLHWSPTNNLLALNTVGEDGNAICLLDPSCPQVC